MNPRPDGWTGESIVSIVPDALRRCHDNARAEFVRATLAGRQLGKACKQVAQLCLPHFEHEERTAFPVLALLPYLQRGDVHPQMKAFLPLIAEFTAKHDALHRHHQSIVDAIEELQLAAQKANNREFVEFALNMKDHERVESEVIYPMVAVIGKYLEEKLAH